MSPLGTQYLHAMLLARCCSNRQENGKVMSASRREAISQINLRRFESAESWRIRLSGRLVNNIKGYASTGWAKTYNR